MRMLIRRQKTAAGRQGFTLTEMAIVAGILGLILAAIWIAASSMYGYLRLTQSNREIMQIVNNMRGLYGEQTLMGTTDTTATLIKAGVFPSEMIAPNGTSAITPWGKTASLGAAAAVNTMGDGFMLEFDTPWGGPCINLLSAVGGSTVAGLAWAGAQTPGGSGMNPMTPPITPSMAAPQCMGTGTVTSQIFFLFILHPVQ